ncbi:hypothetical protein CCP3SC15_3930005 [Gammaproteobacteria bacterium]
METLACSYSGGNSAERVLSSVAHCYPSGMIGSTEIRRLNLIRLIDSHGDGLQKIFAERAGLAPAHVSQVVNGTRKMGESVARRIELNLHIEAGYMDVAHNDLLTMQTALGSSAQRRTLSSLMDELVTRLLCIDPSMRNEVTRLVLRYIENPEANARIAQAVDLLVGDSPPSHITNANLPP